MGRTNGGGGDGKSTRETESARDPDGAGGCRHLVLPGCLSANSAAGGLAHAAVHRSSQAPKACVSKARHGRFSGIIRAVSVDAACFAHNTSDAANGTYFQLYTDDRGVCRIYEMSIGDG